VTLKLRSFDCGNLEIPVLEGKGCQRQDPYSCSCHHIYKSDLTTLISLRSRIEIISLLSHPIPYL
jgi:hypothetical protein